MRRFAYLVMLLLAQRVAHAQPDAQCDPETGECPPIGPTPTPTPTPVPTPPPAGENPAPAMPCDPETGECTSEEPSGPVNELQCDPETGECTPSTPTPEPAPEPCDPSKGNCPGATPPAPAPGESATPTCDPATGCSAELVTPESVQVPACDPASGKCGEAKESEPKKPEPECDPKKEDCACPRNWGCWELIYTTKGTVLGGRVSLTYSDARSHDRTHVGFVTFYSTEHFATRKYLSAHFQGFGSIGGGTAGNEGSAGFTLDVGFRGEVTEQSGPFVRLGMSGLVLGNSAFYVSYLEPIQERVGYQWLDGDKVFEAGATHGTIPIARFDPARHVTRDLSRTSEFGGYAAVQFSEFRVGATFMHILGDGRRDVDLARSQFCNYQLGIALCADSLFVRGRANTAGHRVMTNSLYMGLTVGLSP